ELELKEQEEQKYHFRPFSFQFTKSEEWDGALTDTKWIWPWVRPYKARLLFALILFFFSTLVMVSILRLIAKIVDEVLVTQKSSFLFLGGLLAILIFLRIIADLTYKWMVIKIGQKITVDLRADIFYELGNFPLSFFDKNSSGRLISRCVND